MDRKFMRKIAILGSCFLSVVSMYADCGFNRNGSLIPLIQSNGNGSISATINGNYTYDRNAFNSAINQSDCSLKKLFFGASRLVSGNTFANMQNFLVAYAASTNSVLKNPIAARVGMVAYGNILFALMTDNIWNTYDIRGYLTAQGEIVPATPSTGNPFLHSTFASVPTLQQEGALFVMCNTALAGQVSTLNTFLAIPGLTNQALYLALQQNILPGVLLVPAGVSSMLELQQAGWGYIESSVNTK